MRRERVFGRDDELGAIDEFLAGVRSAARALVFAGPAGVGKTTLLRAAIDQANAGGCTVLRAFPSPSDTRLAFAGLADLLGGRLDLVLPDLAPPQRRLLGAALLVDEPLDFTPDPHVVAAAFLAALRSLARSAPVIVAIDDVQWLDAPSASAVSFAIRRLDGDRAGLLCAVRDDGLSGAPLELDRARLTAEIVSVGGLSLGALHHLVRTELDLSLSHPTLRRVHAESAGNPFMALEIGRALARRGLTRVGSGPLPVPATVSGLVGERLRELPGPVTDALGVVAVLADPPLDRVLAAGVAGPDLDAAFAAGVVELDDSRVRFSHPVLASTVLSSIPPARRRELHAEAARTSASAEERARHRALAAGAPSAEIATELDEAASVAEHRGAPATAAELLELAARLTEDGQPDDRHRRLVSAARLLGRAGETRAASALLTDLAQAAPPGPQHAEVLAYLGWLDEDDVAGSIRLLETALAEAGDTPILRARIHAYLSDYRSMRGDHPGAREDAHRALEFAEQTSDQALTACLLAHAFLCDFRCGLQPDERQLDRALDLERGLSQLSESELEPPSEAAGLYLNAMGRLDEARLRFESVLARAEAEGIEYVRADMLNRLSQLVSRTGDPRLGLELAQTGLEIAEQLDLGQLTGALLFGCGFAALQLGQPEAVAEYVDRGVQKAREVGDRVFLRMHQALPGALDLARGDFAGAAATLRPLIPHLPALGRRFESLWLPETVEALIGVGELDAAAELLASLTDRHKDPLSLAAGARCRGLLAAAEGRTDEAIAELTRALQLREGISDEPVERGRILLGLGSTQRRLKQRRVARESLGAAIACFEGAEAVIWAERAKAELARVSGRVPGTAGELTVTERRVAELVANGMSNRAAAAQLVVTVRTIESTLTKVYAKLGVSSRTQLASKLREDG
ncbi:MAG TPA: AAA family ATPase [Streptosporangiaceae bacterium]|nr:AAA family ATPase [Streptosporangiaceae bacterium]